MKGSNELADTPYSERFKPVYKLVSTRTKYLGAEMSEALDGLNQELASCADRIKDNQPRKIGALTLHFTTCSKKESCNGCPHPVWLSWFNPTNGVNPDKWAAKKVIHPRRHIPKNATPELKQVIDEALKLIEIRKKLLEAVSSISRNVTWIEKRYPAIFSE